MINATYNGQTYQDVTTLVASDGTNSATVTLTESGGGGGISEFSKQNTVTIVNPTEEAVIGAYTGMKFAHGLGETPKLVILTSNAAMDGTVKGINTGAVLCDYENGYVSGNARVGGFIATTNASSGISAATFCSHYDAAIGGSYSEFDWDSTYVYISRSANNQHFGDTLTYTALCFA